MVPSGANTILNLTLAGVEAVNALPLKNSVSISLGASRPAGAAKRAPALNRSAAAAPTILAFMDVLRKSPTLQLYPFLAGPRPWSAVNGDARSALSPGFSGQPKIEPGRDEEKKHRKNNVSKLKDKSA